MKNWLLVANAALARLLEETDEPGAYVHRADLVHPQSRQKGIELQTDRAGIVLVASNPFLGHLKAHLGEQSRKAILRTVSGDYTSLRDDELHKRLAST